MEGNQGVRRSFICHIGAITQEYSPVHYTRCQLRDCQQVLQLEAFRGSQDANQQQFHAEQVCRKQVTAGLLSLASLEGYRKPQKWIPFWIVGAGARTSPPTCICRLNPGGQSIRSSSEFLIWSRSCHCSKPQIGLSWLQSSFLDTEQAGWVLVGVFLCCWWLMIFSERGATPAFSTRSHFVAVVVVILRQPTDLHPLGNAACFPTPAAFWVSSCQFCSIGFCLTPSHHWALSCVRLSNIACCFWEFLHGFSSSWDFFVCVCA